MESTNVQSREPSRGVTFEDAWAFMQETFRQLKEMGAETDRRMAETAQQLKEMGVKTDQRMAETAQQLKEMGVKTDQRMAETAQQIKETQRIVGGLGNRFGDIAEQLLIPALQGKFMDIGFSFDEIARNVVRKNESHDFFIELDALLKNDKQAMVVEVKAKLDKTDIDEQIGRMEKVRQYANLHGDSRQYYCAIATMTAKEAVIAYALSMGFYLIMPSGEDVKVTKPTSEPRVW